MNFELFTIIPLRNYYVWFVTISWWNWFSSILFSTYLHLIENVYTMKTKYIYRSDIAILVFFDKIILWHSAWPQKSFICCPLQTTIKNYIYYATQLSRRLKYFVRTCAKKIRKAYKMRKYHFSNSFCKYRFSLKNVSYLLKINQIQLF